MTIVAAADGSALGNPGPAGWAWVISDQEWRAGGWPRATNNQGELMAVLDLLRSTESRRSEPLHVLCDSQYVINSVTKWMPGWKRKGWRKADGKPVLNRELLEDLDAALRGREVRFEWVKGHAGHPLNEAADTRARAAATAYQQRREPDAGPGLIGTGAVRGAQPAPVPPPADPAHAETDPAVPAPALFDLLDLASEPTSSGTATSHSALPAQPVPNPDHRTEVVELERTLLDPAVRGDARRLDELLHPEFVEIGASGRLRNREAIRAELLAAPALEADCEPLSVLTLAPGVVQLVYRCTARVDGESRRSLRSSVWERVDGVYRIRFHQGTVEV